MVNITEWITPATYQLTSLTADAALLSISMNARFLYIIITIIIITIIIIIIA